MDELWSAYSNLNTPLWGLQWRGSYHLRFDGDVEFHSGDWYQVLTDSIHWDIVPLRDREAHPPILNSAAPDFARGRNEGSPSFLHGMLWRVTDGAIEGIFGDDFFMGWKWLESDFSVGHEFLFQIHDDFNLHSRVMGLGTHWTGSELVRDVVQVFYVWDLGVVGLRTIEDPDPIGYFRPLDYGVVYFAPGIGPVYSHSRHMVNAADPDLTGIEDIEVLLYTHGK